MSDRYDFGNLSPIEFEGVSVDLVAAETGLGFERFSEGRDGGMDGRHSSAEGRIILQAKHYKNSTWSDLQTAAASENRNLIGLNPTRYFFLTSQPLTPKRKEKLRSLLGHPSVATADIWGRGELNALLAKHGDVEKRNIKLWITSTTILQRILTNDVSVFTESTRDEIQRILKVYVANPSLEMSKKILDQTHCLIISGPPGVGKTTLAQVLAAEYSDMGWELVSMSSIDDGRRMFESENRQVFIFDDFLGSIKLDPSRLAKDDAKIAGFFNSVSRSESKRFILTTRAYILQSARIISEALDDRRVELTEMVLNLETYTRELKARILYNHLYHSGIDDAAVQALLEGDTVRRIVDHRHYMPRIIQWMTDEILHRDVAAKDYPAQFLRALDNPQKIWEKAFRQHISTKAQVLLFCMFFSDYEHFPDTGVPLEKLKPFFERSLSSFGAVDGSLVRATMLEEALREVKSSFLVIDVNRAKFINPSVQDFLSRETSDPGVLIPLANAVHTTSTGIAIWKKSKQTFPSGNKSLREVASSLLKAMRSGIPSDRKPLNEFADYVGDLIVETDNTEFCQSLRNDGLSEHFWTVESKLPRIIDELTEGRFKGLPYAGPYARYLRLQIFRLVSARDYVMDIEELADLAIGLASSAVEMCEEFNRLYDEAVQESVDIMGVSTLSNRQDPESIVSEWLKSIDKIETYSETAVDSWKKRELQEYLSSMQMEEDMQQQWEEQHGVGGSSESRSTNRFGNSGPSGEFSNRDLSAMFSSLKK